MKRALILIPAVLALAACGEKPAKTTDAQTNAPSPEQQMAEANAKAGADFLASNKDKDGVITTGSGLQYKVIKSGPEDGVSPKPGQFVCVNYAGRLLDGTEFDSSYKRGRPAAFPSDRLIKGWVEALSKMKPGDEWELYIPSNLAYGAKGAPGSPIGPDATLVFDVNLIRNMNIDMAEYMQTYGKNPMLDCSKGAADASPATSEHPAPEQSAPEQPANGGDH